MAPSLLKISQYSCLYLGSPAHLACFSITQIIDFISIHSLVWKTCDSPSMYSCSRWAGVSGSRSSSSDETRVSSRSFSTASISTTIVSKVGSDTCRLPRTFLIAVLVSPTSRSQNPPYQGALFGMNFQVPLLPLVTSSRNTSLLLQRGRWIHCQKSLFSEG